MSATLSTSMPAPCPPLCRPPCPPQCRPPQCRLDALWGLRDADRMEIQKYHGGTYLLYTDGLTGVCARDACAFKYTKTQVSYQTAFVCKWLSAIFCSLASQLPMDCIDPPTDIFLREPFIAIIWIVIIIISIIRCHGNICKKNQIITLGIVKGRRIWWRKLWNMQIPAGGSFPVLLCFFWHWHTGISSGGSS